jgi:hypothetical protein
MWRVFGLVIGVRWEVGRKLVGEKARRKNEKNEFVGKKIVKKMKIWSV